MINITERGLLPERGQEPPQWSAATANWIPLNWTLQDVVLCKCWFEQILNNWTSNVFQRVCANKETIYKNWTLIFLWLQIDSPLNCKIIDIWLVSINKHFIKIVWNFYQRRAWFDIGFIFLGPFQLLYIFIAYILILFV